MPYSTISVKTILKNHFFEIKDARCKKKDGKIIEHFFTIIRPDVAIIAAFTKEKNIVLIHQYRYSVKATNYEIPAGYIEKHDKSIKISAQRELLEETGYNAGKLILLKKTFASAGLMNNSLYHFLALDCEKIQEQQLDENEEIEVKIVSLKKALEMLEQGKIKDMASVACLLLARDYLSKHNVIPKSFNPDIV